MFDKSHLFRSLATVMAVVLSATADQAATIDTVPVGNAGNAADSTGFGAVS